MPQLVTGRGFDLPRGNLVAIVINISDPSDVGDFTVAVIGCVFLFRITKTSGEIKMQLVIHLLAFKHQNRITVNRSIDFSKTCVVQRLGKIDTRDTGSELGVNWFYFHTDFSESKK